MSTYNLSEVSTVLPSPPPPPSIFHPSFLPSSLLPPSLPLSALLSLHSEVCGEFPEGPPTIYKSRPDAEGCEATAESQSGSGTIPTPPPVKKPLNTSDVPHVQRKHSVPNSTASPRVMTKSMSLQEVHKSPPLSTAPTGKTSTNKYQRLHSVPPSPNNPNNGATRPRSLSTQSAQEATPQLYKLPSLAGIPSIPSSSASSSSPPFPTTTIHKSSHHQTSTPPNSVPSTMASKMMAPLLPPPLSALTTSNESQLRARHASAVALPQIQPMETNRLSSHRPGHSRNNSLTSSFPTRPSHSRNSSLGAISHRSHSRNNSFGNISVGEISLLSNASESMHSINSVNIDSSVVQPKTYQQTDPQTASNEGYNFARHFNLFSQFTSNMALEYCSQRTEETPMITAPPIWCMDVWNQVVAVGCGNGQIEVGVAKWASSRDPMWVWSLVT